MSPEVKVQSDVQWRDGRKIWDHNIPPGMTLQRMLMKKKKFNFPWRNRFNCMLCRVIEPVISQGSVTHKMDSIVLSMAVKRGN